MHFLKLANWGSLTHAVRLPLHRGFMLLSHPNGLGAMSFVKVEGEPVALSGAYPLDEEVQASEQVEVFVLNLDAFGATSCVGLPCGLGYQFCLGTTAAPLTVAAQGRPSSRTIVLSSSTGQTVTIAGRPNCRTVTGASTELVHRISDAQIQTLCDVARLFATIGVAMPELRP